MNRRRFFFVLPVLAAVRCSRADSPSSDRPASAAAGETASPPREAASRVKMNIALAPGVLCLISWIIAEQKDFFSAEGLDVEVFERDLSQGHLHGWNSVWVRGPSGLLRNDAMVVEYPVLQDMASGAMDYYIVAGEHSGCRQLVVPVGSPIRSVAELRGRRVGLRPTEDTLMWEYLIGPPRPGAEPTRFVFPSFASGDPREVQWVTEQFAANQIAAYGGADPVPEILIADGVARRLASNTWTPPLNGWYCCMLALRKELVDRYPDLPQRFTRAMRAAASFVEKNPAEAVAFVVSQGRFPPATRQDLSARLLGEYVWTTTGRIQDDLERYFQILIDAGRMPATTPPAELVRRVYRGAEA
jgi:ABC-type nitrate/sulfonate/bicarbonate transport system substrate-binding protein